MAPNWDQHYLLAWGGPFFATEQWSCSLRFSIGSTMSVPGFPQGELVDWAASVLTEVRDKVKTFHVGANGLSNQATLAWVKFNLINAEGHYGSQVSNTADVLPVQTPSGQITGGAAGSWLPPQLALAVTLKSDLRSGRGAFGRVFLPPQSYNMQSGSPYIEAASCSTIATAFQTFVQSLNNWSGLDPGFPEVAILSRERIPDPEDPTPLPHADPETTVVTSVRVGNVYDTIRRRRNQLRETYVSRDI